VRSRLAVVAAGAAFVLLTLAVVGHFGPLFRLDAAVSVAARRAALAHPAWRSALAGITQTGSTTVLGPVTAVGCLLLLWRRRWGNAVFVAVGMLLTLGLRLLIVVNVARPRPADRLGAAAGWSFPSGHTAASATAGLLAILICWPMLQRRWSRALLCVLVGGWVVVVGYSRVGLVVHWPSDVVGSWLLVSAVVPSIGALLRVLLPDRAAREHDVLSAG
jgi:undecaprenyl-diphosphatase